MEDIHDPQNITGMGAILFDNTDDTFNVSSLENAAKLGLDDSASLAGDVDYTSMMQDKIHQTERNYVSSAAPVSAQEYDDDPFSRPRHRAPADQFSTGLTYGGGIAGGGTSTSGAIASDGYLNRDKYTAPRDKQPVHIIDEQMQRMTDEERKQTHLNHVLSGHTGAHAAELDMIQTCDDEDDRALMLEKITALRRSLMSDEIDLKNIVEVGPDTELRTIKTVLHTLMIMHDRSQYREMFNEIVVMGAYGLERFFDGEKKWFGTQLNLTGWSRRVNVKLQTMNYETSSLVGDIMKSANFGPGARIALALIPSLFLHSRDTRNRTNNGLDQTAEYRTAIEGLAARERRHRY